MSAQTGRPGQIITMSQMVMCGAPIEVARLVYDTQVINPLESKLDGDLYLRQMCEHYGWSPGLYLMVVENRYDGRELTRMEWALPVAPEWAALDNNGRRFGFTVLSRYPGATPALVGGHLGVFGDHYNARITTAELTEITGYVLPEGVTRPSSPGVDAAAVAAKP